MQEAIREMKAAWDKMPSGGETDEEKAANAREAADVAAAEAAQL